MWPGHFIIITIIIPSGLSFHLVEMMAQIEADRCPRCIQQGVRGWHWHGHGSRSLKCATTAGGGEGDGTKQPKWKSGFHNILGMVLPDQFICFNRTLNPHLSKQNWTTVITNIKSSPCPSQGPKVAWKLFPPKRLDRTWFYRAMCYVLSSFLEIWNRFLTPVTLKTVSSTAWADWAHSGN